MTDDLRQLQDKMRLIIKTRCRLWRVQAADKVDIKSMTNLTTLSQNGRTVVAAAHCEARIYDAPLASGFKLSRKMAANDKKWQTYYIVGCLQHFS